MGAKSFRIGFRKPISGKPVSGNAFPKTALRKPVSGNGFPETGFRKPVSGTRFPETGFRKQVSGKRFPETDFRKPGSGNRFPENGVRKPESEIFIKRSQNRLSKITQIRLFQKSLGKHTDFEDFSRIRILLRKLRTFILSHLHRFSIGVDCSGVVL